MILAARMSSARRLATVGLLALCAGRLLRDPRRHATPTPSPPADRSRRPLRPTPSPDAVRLPDLRTGGHDRDTPRSR